HTVPAQAVDLSGFAHVPGEVDEELPHQEDVADVGRRGQDEGREGVQHTEVFQQKVVGDQQHLAGDHHEQQQAVVDLVPAGKAQPAEGVARHRVDVDVDDGAHHRHEQRVEEPPREQGTVAENGGVVVQGHVLGDQ